jgi:hypothetical protein
MNPKCIQAAAAVSLKRSARVTGCGKWPVRSARRSPDYGRLCGHGHLGHGRAAAVPDCAVASKRDDRPTRRRAHTEVLLPSPLTALWWAVGTGRCEARTTALSCRALASSLVDASGLELLKNEVEEYVAIHVSAALDGCFGVWAESVECTRCASRSSVDALHDPWNQIS